MSGQVAWKRETEHAAFAARDSAGYLVYKDKLWLLGGWTPRRMNDVWCSADGVNWTQVIEHAPWEARNVPFAAVHQDRMWLLGGGSGTDASNYHMHADVWHSDDGATWVCATPKAPWRERSGLTALSFKGKLWIMGGMSGYGHEPGAVEHFADVWASDDGADWDCVTARAPWGQRSMHSSVVFKGRMWVIGGGHYSGIDDHADVWASSDGVNWDCVIEHAPWPARRFHESIVYDDALWVIGGCKSKDAPPYNLNDVWYSRDGRQWIEANHHAPWRIRHEMALYSFKGKLWVINGCSENAENEKYNIVFNDVWTYTRPEK